MDKKVEHKLTQELTNDPSAPIKVRDFYVVFQRPKLKDKHRHEAWGDRMLEEMGVSETSGLGRFYVIWSSMNSWVKEIYVPSPNGELVIEGKKYAAKEKTDSAYFSLFEQFITEKHDLDGEVSEPLVMEVFEAYLDWNAPTADVEADDIKNS